MKKVMFMIVGMLFAASVNAASLSWDSSTTVGWTTYESDELITATQNFSLITEPVDLTLEFNVTDGSVLLDGFVVEITDAQFDITSVLLDNTTLSFDSITSTWSLPNILSLSSGSYELVIALASATAGGLLNVQISAVPVPAALFLFAPALLGFFGLRRKAAVAA